jgi:hypothetical protein
LLFLRKGGQSKKTQQNYRKRISHRVSPFRSGMQE